ncbi:MAG: porin family protein [Bacteroides sp.]|nr:porin family protein [Bacteroides sp.]
MDKTNLYPGGKSKVYCHALTKPALTGSVLIKLLVAIAILFYLAVLPSVANAGQNTVKGEKTLGIRGGYASYNESGFTSIFFEYSFAPHFRIAPEIGYVYRHHDKTAFVFDVDMHFPFKIVSGLKVYPLAGLAFNNWSYHDDSNKSRIGANFGVGFDFYMTQNFKLNLQAKYSWLPSVSGLFTGIGLGYIF